jgi:hypothetical protein
MVLNALYVCLHAFSLRRESPDPDPERQTPHFRGGSVTQSDPQHRFHVTTLDRTGGTTEPTRPFPRLP